jgi:acetylornithine deacetylase
MHPVEMTRALIDIESITENEKQVGEYLLRYLSGLAAPTGGTAEAMAVSPERFNVYAEWGRPAVTLSTHMDTVPPFVASREDDDQIYGRGACDAKGIIAAMIGAAEKLLESGTRNFALLFVVGEEKNSSGADVAARAPRGSLYLIDGEPTESKVALGSKGMLRYEIVATGKMAHSAYPELGESAIEKLIDALDAIRRVPLPEDSLLGRTTVNIGTISGGRAPNIVPDAAKAELAIRLVGDAQVVDAALRRAVGDRAAVNEILRFPVVRHAALDGFPTCVVAFSTDIPVLSPAWGEPFLFGPGSIHVAHTPEERIAKKELLDAVDTYASMVKMLLSRAGA